MKRILLSLMLFINIFVCGNINAHNVKFYKNLNVENIDEVIVNIPSNVYLLKNENSNFNVDIKTSKKEYNDLIKYEIKNNVLYIDFDYDLEYQKQINSNDINIYIKSPKSIKKISTNSNLLVAKSIYKNNAANKDEKR